MASKKSYHAVILSTSARGTGGPTWGLGADSQIVEQVLRDCHCTMIEHIDPISFYGGSRPPAMADIQIHLEIPCRAAMRWAAVNIVVVNPEWWPVDVWDWAFSEMDYFIFKSAHARALYPKLEAKKTRVVNWRAASDIQQIMGNLGKAPPKREFLYLIGSSKNKLTVAKTLCASWKITWPHLLVVGSEEVIKVLEPIAAAGVTLRTPFPTNKERIETQAMYAYHIVASAAEGFGYTFAEAACVGALPVWTGIPIYDELWKSTLGDVGRIPVHVEKPTDYYDSTRVNILTADIEKAVKSLLHLTDEEDMKLRGKLKHVATQHVKEFRTSWKSLLSSCGTHMPVEIVSLPPPLPARADLPSVAIITLTYNRKRWWANMARNIIKTDYPPERLCWIIADDSEAGERIDADVIKFQSMYPSIHVKYLSLPRRLAIGDKRNKAISAAPADCSVFVMMDDDDHYPKRSVIGRVAWLRALQVECVYCSTLPMYVCHKYISAMNVPPLSLAPAERVSEASLCFTRAFWEEMHFPGPVNIAEGEAFLIGREHQTAEIPPDGIIISFCHSANLSSRRVPSDTEANGCHYGFDDEYFSYLCAM